MEDTYCRQCGTTLRPAMALMGICTECVAEAAARPVITRFYPPIRAPRRLSKVPKWNKPSQT